MTQEAQPALVHRARAINSKLNEIAESAGVDPELIALAAIVAAFEQLDPAEAVRVVDYLRSRYGRVEY